MAQVEISKILNSLRDIEMKEENWSAKTVENLNKLWSRDNEMQQERLTKIEKEIFAQKKLKNKVQNLKKEIQKLIANDIDCRGKISELKSLLNETDGEIHSRQSEEKKLKQHYESRKKELSKLEEVKSLLKTQQSLYDHCLNTRLSSEGSNLLKLSFVDHDQCVGWIKLEYIESTNHFTITDVEPRNIIPDWILNKFHTTQDTQGLLCYVCQNLAQN